MKVFLTGATGFIGSRIVKELLSNGHSVLGLSRSDAGAKGLIAAGAEVHRGDLEDLETLRKGAAASEGVIHCGFVHDFSRFQEVCEIDRRAIETMGAALVGTSRPFVITSGTGIVRTPGRASTEDDEANSPMPRVASEQAGEALSQRGVRVSIMRLPQVHDPVKQGLITYLVATAREKGVSAYVGDGAQRWPASHVLDTARLYRLALEKDAPFTRYHAVAEEGVSMRKIAEVLGKGLKLPVVSKSPEEAGEHFGWLAMFAGHDMPSSSKLTRERLGWNPTGPGLISDLEKMDYSQG
jgi:nucleoside-diphosphate-sugar epimerase